MTEPLLAIRDLSKTFPMARNFRDVVTRSARQNLRALRDVSLTIQPGEVVGVVGESGCGKSTLGRCIAGLESPEQGDILWQGAPITAGANRRTRARHIQMVFQDPYASLNPRMTLGQTLEEVLHVHGLAGNATRQRERVDELMLMVGLAPALKDRLPHTISGGQRQRICIARALAVEPQLIVADEPVSALDASVQAQIINLLEDLRVKLNIALIFIAHDLNVVRHISDRVAVMYLGEIVETAAADALFTRPLHPYTRGLLAAIPMPDPKRRTSVPSIEGEIPDPLSPPIGCGFSTRCSHVIHPCRARHPDLYQTGEHGVRCLNPAATFAEPGSVHPATGNQ
ncbi:MULTISPECIES: oligopeptide/dipeptide ABC transporter ATP-binding protein [unclassified Mesorhizobium]|uniref:ABC transporter ATP-binding protein n=1 Tax=unclassified Mesorhizobium TaxID=325217 RepID=UPI001AEE7DD1|nr:MULTISPECIES: oligopeptide/dipeptide ABC transporter ATP-binding protein [unclassified Mesorhizobium]MBZ9974184.1 ATP-binding cassette domain-containing protein [Mesorhizobium sp. BR-1-1-10]